MTGLTLYHHPLSVCSMKTRLALEEKGLSWESRVVDIVHAQEQLEPWYVRLNPVGVVPTLEHQGTEKKVVTNSAVIIRYIAALDDGARLVPETEKRRGLMEELIDLADGIDLQILSYARHPSMEKSEKVLDARIAKSRAMAEKHADLVDSYKVSAERSLKNKSFRVDPEQVGNIERNALEALDFAERQLAKGPYLAGDDYTLADVIWTVVLARLELLKYTDWVLGRAFPELANYYQRCKARESFVSAQVQNQWWQK